MSHEMTCLHIVSLKTAKWGALWAHYQPGRSWACPWTIVVINCHHLTYNLICLSHFSADENVSEVCFQWAHLLNCIAYVPQVTDVIVQASMVH